MGKLNTILARFHGKSLVWIEGPGRPTVEQTSTDYEDGYRGEQWVGTALPRARLILETVGSPVPISLQGTRWPWASLMTIPKPKVRQGHGHRGSVHPCARGALCCSGTWVQLQSPVRPHVPACARGLSMAGALRVLPPAEYVVGVPNKSNTAGEVSGAGARLHGDRDVLRCGTGHLGAHWGWGQRWGLTLL